MGEGEQKAWKTKEISQDPREGLLRPQEQDPNLPGPAHAAVMRATAFISITG